MNTKKINRRRFLWTVGGSVGLSSWVSRAIAQEQGELNPKRFVLFQKPIGTIAEAFWPRNGSGANLAAYDLNRILRPLESHVNDMAVFRGLGLPHRGSAGGGHERGTVLTVTGRRCPNLYAGNGGDDPQSEGPSVDQLLLRGSRVLQDAPIQSLQTSCDQRADTAGEVSPRHLSYSGARAPMRPYYQPLETYDRVFGSLTAGAGNDSVAKNLLAKKSVLDFSLRDLERMRSLTPSSQWEKLDAYEGAVRALEDELNELGVDNLSPGFCGVSERPPNISVSTRLNAYSSDNIVPQRDDVKHRQIGELHLAVIRAAFKCDLTRVAAFQWSPGTNHVSFADMWPPDPSVFKVHHTTSHKPPSNDVNEFLTRIDVWYAERLNEFITSLKNTTDITGKPIFDSTVLAYITEVSYGYNHSWDNMPWVAFGGKDTGFRGGQMWRHDGSTPSSATSGRMRSTNDYWMAMGRPFGFENFTLGNDQSFYSGPIQGIFDRTI